MTYRRRAVLLLPLSGAALLAACSKESSTPAPAGSSGTSGGTADTTAAPPPGTGISPSTGQVTPPATAPTPSPAAPPATTTQAPAPDGGAMVMVQTGDPTAVSLGYVEKSAQADTKRFPNHAPGQACGNCSLYAGKPTDPHAACPVFAGKHVLATGWCSAYVKKAA